VTDRYETLVPRPREARATVGEFELDQDTVLVADDLAAADAVRLLLAPLRLPLRPAGEAVDNAITVRLDQAVGSPESFELQVAEDGITVTAADLDGVRHATQVLRQLLPDDAWRAVGRPGTAWRVQAGEVADAPTLSWRGAMLDVSRYFFPKRTLLRYVDLLAMHRMNRLHLHLTDDQGWRIESRLHPEVHEHGSHRPYTQAGRDRSAGRNDGTPHGGFYTLDDLTEIATYASERGVTIVPEIDLPGHSSALLASHPELGIGEHTVLTGWGISSGVLKPTPPSVALLSELIGELVDAVPTPYVHLGGDECVMKDWATDPEVTAYLAEVGLTKHEDLHGHFLRALGSRLSELGKRMVVWDEAFVTGGLLEDSIVMAWRGDGVARRAAAAGYDVVRAPVFPTYLNYDQSDSPDEPLAQGGPILLSDVAEWQPVPNEWSDAERAHVLGGQFQAWSEYIPHERHLDYMMFPRASVVAEVVWHGAPATDVDKRLEAHLGRLAAAGVEYRPLDGGHPWQLGGTGDRRRQTGSTMAAERAHHEEISVVADVVTTTGGY
jgi:hexosaminidase